MSIHSSLKSSATMKRHRSVLSRLERVRILQERGTFHLEESSTFGLPKVKHLKIRIKKEKTAAPAPGATEATAVVGGGSPSATPVASGKPSAPGAKTPQKATSPTPAEAKAGPGPKKKE